MLTHMTDILLFMILVIIFLFGYYVTGKIQPLSEPKKKYQEKKIKIIHALDDKEITQEIHKFIEQNGDNIAIALIYPGRSIKKQNSQSTKTLL